MPNSNKFSAKQIEEVKNFNSSLVDIILDEHLTNSETEKTMPTEELVRRYKELYKKKFNEDLSDEEAFAQAMNLVTIVNTIYRPILFKK